MLYLVMRQDDFIDDVEAYRVHFCPSGALVFSDEEDILVQAYAPGEWREAAVQQEVDDRQWRWCR